MAKQKTTTEAVAKVSLERVARLYRLLELLGRGPQARTTLLRRLRLGVRGFYRDLEVLREVGILVDLSQGKYCVRDEAKPIFDRLPFPDPNLNLGDARLLARGRSSAHKKIREQLAKIEK